MRPNPGTNLTTFASLLCSLFLMAVQPAVPANAQVPSSELTIPYPTDAVQGQGFNVFPGFDVTLSPCVDAGNPVTTVGGSQAVTPNLQIVDDAQSIVKVLSVSLQGSFDEDAGVESAGADFSSEMASSVTINKHVVNLVASVDVASGSKFYSTFPDLTPENAAMYANDYVKFRSRCGDYWIKSIEYGGQFYGAVSVTTDSTQEETGITATLSAYETTPVASASAQATFASELKTAAASSQITIKQFSNGGNGIASSQDVGTMLTAYSNFATSVLSAPAPLRIVLAPYSEALPDGFSANPVALQYQAAVDTLGKLAIRRYDYTLARDAISDIVNTPQTWYFEQNAPAALQAQIDGIVNGIDQLAGTCNAAPVACVTNINAFLKSDPGPATIIEGSPNYPVPIVISGLSTQGDQLVNNQLSSGGVRYCLNLQQENGNVIAWALCPGQESIWGVNQQNGWLQSTVNGDCVTYNPAHSPSTMVIAPCAQPLQPNQQWAYLKDGTIRNNAIAATNSWCLGSSNGGPGNQSGYWLSPIFCDNTTAGGTLWTAVNN